MVRYVRQNLTRTQKEPTVIFCRPAKSAQIQTEILQPSKAPASWQVVLFPKGCLRKLRKTHHCVCSRRRNG